MKKLLVLTLAALMLVSCFAFASCGKNDTILVQTNAYFAPFEYYKDTEIVGVDVEIMAKVGEKLGKEVKFADGDFGIIIDLVSKGDLADVGAAGITVTDARKEKVDFSTPYYTSVQYVLFDKNADVKVTKAADGTEYVLWNDLAGKSIGVQMDTTADIYTGGEIEEGALKDTGAKLERYDSAQLAADAVKAGTIDICMVDKLPASYISGKSDAFTCVPVYYKGENGEADTPTVESYAICVTKGKTELLNAINEVLAELGTDGIENMIKAHMGIA